ncbi:fluoride efflux transporter FluC [Bacillus marinisedimentorum]|uniref:fluoride efflux transporter FluC n=1 Tax=Bacillus marinisedimentorum TaxID=1821260 RepID=UPI000872CF64|nr:CrcB family protein [Bacillus marinisedimentorum]
MLNIFGTGLGGALGAAGRYYFSIIFNGDGFPTGTLLANVFGSFLLGILIGYKSKKHVDRWIYNSVGTGLLGGFTTMSAFAGEAVSLGGEFAGTAVLYISISLAAGIFSAFFGYAAGERAAERNVGEAEGGS